MAWSDRYKDKKGDELGRIEIKTTRLGQIEIRTMTERVLVP